MFQRGIIKASTDPKGVVLGAGLSLICTVVKDASHWLFHIPTEQNVFTDSINYRPSGKEGHAIIHLSAGSGSHSHPSTTNLSGIDQKKSLIGPAVYIVAIGTIAYGAYYYVNKKQRNKNDVDENTPLHKAVIKNKKAEIKELLNINSAIGFFKPTTNVNAQNKHGDTALHLAIKNNRPDIIKILLRKGADPYLANKYGERPYHMARASKFDRVKRAMSIRPAAHSNSEQNFVI